MASTYLAVISLSLLSVATTAAGVALALRVGRNERGISFGIGFAAGIMLLISSLELVPEAVAGAGPLTALITAGLGGLALFILHLAIPHSHLVKEEGGIGSGRVKSAYLVVFGLILHDFPEGFAMANSFVASPSLGVLVAIGIALHNLPEEFAMAVPVLLLRRKGLLFGSAFLSSLAEPAGAIAGLIAADSFPQLNSLFLAFAAGAMIFVSLHELLPMARMYGHLKTFSAGIGFGAVAYWSLSAAI